MRPLAGICIDCKKEPAIRGKRCPKCQEANEFAQIARRNKAAQVKRAAHRAANPLMCACGVNQLEGRRLKCAECRAKSHRESNAASAKHMNSQAAERKSEVFKKPKPRKKVKIIKTAAQVARELKAEDARLAEVRARLNPELMAYRNLRGAIVAML